MSRQCQILRVFTRDGVGGNHLGVVTDLNGLTTEMLQAIAVDLGFSETIFCDLSGEVPVARIFTPGAELPFTGHPLVELGWALRPVERIRYKGWGGPGQLRRGSDLDPSFRRSARGGDRFPSPGRGGESGE